MPYAIVIHAFPRTDLPLAHAQGKILHGLFYEFLQNASAAKGDEVHSVEGLKPFSTALLLNERQRRAEFIRAGEEVKIRFTFLGRFALSAAGALFLVYSRPEFRSGAHGADCRAYSQYAAKR